MVIVVGADRRLSIDLPSTTPTGPADLLIVPRHARPSAIGRPGMDAARELLRTAGLLGEGLPMSEGATALTPAERERLGRMPSDARGSEMLIDEDRGP